MSANDRTNEDPLSRRVFLGGALTASAALAACNSAGAQPESQGAAPATQTPSKSAPSASVHSARKGYPVLVGSNNALAGMKLHYDKLVSGADPLDVVIEVVKVTEADPKDDSVGLGGLPNADGVVQLDAACMYGPRHKSGAVACIENILHPSEVARLVLERTDHCLLVGHDAYRFARMHGHEHVDLLTPESREKWIQWKENLSKEDDYLPPPPKIPWQGALPKERDARTAALAERMRRRQWGTIHCSALAKDGAIACTTTTSGLSWKVPGRVGDSPILGAGLYCDQGAGSAGSTGRGEANILSCGSYTIVEQMRHGVAPLDAAMEVLRRITHQTQMQARYQPELVDEHGLPSFNIIFYVLGLDGTVASAALKVPQSSLGERTHFAVSTPDKGPHLQEVVGLHE